MPGKDKKQALKVYVETSVWGMTLPSQPRALREPSKRFLRQCRTGLFIPYILQQAAGILLGGYRVQKVNSMFTFECW